MLDSLLFFIINAIYGLLRILSRLLGVDSFGALIKSAFDPVDGLSHKKNQLIIPSHLAVDLVESENITWVCFYFCIQTLVSLDFSYMNSFQKQLFDLIMYSSAYGIKRISLYDPHSALKEKKETFLKFLKAHLKRKNSNVIPITDFENPPVDLKNNSFIHISILGAADGRGSLIRACRNVSRLRSLQRTVFEFLFQLCHLDREIATSDIDEQLIEQSIFEPDLLLKLGSINSLAGYPPWSLRVTEIVSFPRFSCESGVRESEFTQILADFSSWDRRLGKYVFYT